MTTNIFIFKLNKVGTKKELMNQVLELFEQMMNLKCAKSIAKERKKLQSDNTYFQSWCLTLPDWCPDVATYT